MKTLALLSFTLLATQQMMAHTTVVPHAHLGGVTSWAPAAATVVGIAFIAYLLIRRAKAGKAQDEKTR